MYDTESTHGIWSKVLIILGYNLRYNPLICMVLNLNSYVGILKG